MSANSVGGFMQELLETAKAAAKLPDIEAELKRAQDQIIADGQRIARLESKLRDRSLYIDTLTAQLRSVEAERDNAGFRELEATDREDNLKRVIRDCQIAIGEVMKAMEPVTAEPQVDPTAEATPSTQSPLVAISGIESSAVSEPFAPYLGEQPIPDQSEFHPTQEAATATSTEGQSVHSEEKAFANALAKPMEDGELNPRPTEDQVLSTGIGTESDTSSFEPEDKTSHAWHAWNQRRLDEAQEVSQPDPIPAANGQTASAESTTESASAPPSDDWWPRVSQASNYSG